MSTSLTSVILHAIRTAISGAAKICNSFILGCSPAREIIHARCASARGLSPVHVDNHNRLRRAFTNLIKKNHILSFLKGTLVFYLSADRAPRFYIFFILYSTVHDKYTIHAYESKEKALSFTMFLVFEQLKFHAQLS